VVSKINLLNIYHLSSSSHRVLSVNSFKMKTVLIFAFCVIVAVIARPQAPSDPKSATIQNATFLDTGTGAYNFA
jgi:hypothetical protein